MGAQQKGGFTLVRVLGQEIVRVDGKEYQTWVVEQRFLDLDRKPLEIGGQPLPASKHWISRTAPYAIQSEYGPMKVRLKSVTLLPELEP